MCVCKCVRNKWTLLCITWCKRNSKALTHMSIALNINVNYFVFFFCFCIKVITFCQYYIIYNLVIWYNFLKHNWISQKVYKILEKSFSSKYHDKFKYVFKSFIQLLRCSQYNCISLCLGIFFLNLNLNNMLWVHEKAVGIIL